MSSLSAAGFSMMLSEWRVPIYAKCRSDSRVARTEICGIELRFCVCAPAEKCSRRSGADMQEASSLHVLWKAPRSRGRYFVCSCTEDSVR